MHTVEPEYNLFASSIQCPHSQDGRCSRKSYNGCATVSQKSWFSDSKLPIANVIVTQPVHQTSLDDETTSSEMVIDWYNYCQEVCAYKIMKHHVGPIGGEGTTVETDESKFGKMKYHRGRYIEGQWFFSGICCEMKACFLVLVDHRDPIMHPQILQRARCGELIIASKGRAMCISQ